MGHAAQEVRTVSVDSLVGARTRPQNREPGAATTRGPCSESAARPSQPIPTPGRQYSRNRRRLALKLRSDFFTTWQVWFCSNADLREDPDGCAHVATSIVVI